MFDFCHHCGSTIGGRDQVVGQLLVCTSCGKDIGVVKAPPEKVMVDRSEALVQCGSASRCPVCAQLVEAKVTGAGRSLATHFSADGKRKVCPGSGKPVALPAPPSAAVPLSSAAPPPASAPAKKPGAGKDLSAYMHREMIRVVARRRDGQPTIEELKLEYLDRADRVRLQIEALRDILGKSFQMKPYPAELGRPHLRVWSNADQCVVAQAHAQGGYQAMTDDEMRQVLCEVRERPAQFFL